MRQSCNDKILAWMKASYASSDLDMRKQSKEKDLVCILLDIVLYQDSELVSMGFTLLTSYFAQKSAIITCADIVQLLQDQ